MQTKTDIIGMLNMVVSNEKGYRLSTDGSITEYKFDGESYDIQKIKDLCNFDYIELVYLPNDIIMIVDEEDPVLTVMRHAMMDAERLIKPDGTGKAEYWIVCLQRKCVEMYMKLPMAEA